MHDDAKDALDSAPSGIPLAKYGAELLQRFPGMTLAQAIDADMAAGAPDIEAMLRGERIEYLPRRSLPGRRRRR